MRNALAGLALAVVLLPACTSNSPVGAYSLDKDAMKAAIDEQVNKAPEAQRAMVKAMSEMILQMKIDLNLAAEGKGTMTMSMPSMMKDQPAPEPKVSNVTWEQKDGKVLITDPAKPDKKMECTLEGKKLSCQEQGKAESKMVFNKA
ncbi:MAG: hypothetical protein QM765_53545 [Myxococcales bacterium]